MRSILPGLAMLIFQPVIAQQPNLSDTTTSQRNTLNFFYNSISENSFLYNGRHYQKYPFRTNGDPFFIKNEWQNGDINYDGVLYNTRLMFDMEKNKLIIPFFSDDRILIELIADKVSSFSIDEHHFIHIDDSLQNVPEGFYEIVYDGKMQLLAHRKKYMHENFQNLVRISYTESVTYYLLKDGKYSRADRYKEVLRLLKDKEKELKKYSRQNGFTYSDEKEKELIRLIAYYDQLTK
jgi:hypothetical protein